MSERQILEPAMSRLDRIDEAIDKAVRDLMNVDADSAFRARVVERLRKPKPRAPFWRQLSIAAGAVGIALIAVILTREAEKPAVEAPPVAVASAVTPQPFVEPAAAVTSTPGVSGPATTPTALRRPENLTHRIAKGALVATLADETPEPPLGGGVEPLTDIRPIELAQITPAPIITAEITITPIAQPSELVIAPLAPQIERE
jgi:hypothetical protein